MNLPAKTFWKSPQGDVGKIVLGVGLVGGGVALSFALPVLIVFFSNLIYASVLGGVVLFGGATLLHPRVQFAIGAGFQGFIKKITSRFISKISILNFYIKKLKDDIIILDKQIGDVGGHTINLTRVITENTLKIQTYNTNASKARDNNHQDVAIQIGRKSRRLKRSNDKMIPLRDKLQIMKQILQKMSKNSKIVAVDLEDEVSTVMRDTAAIQATVSTFRSANKLISGNDKAMIDETLTSLVDDYGMVLGELDQLMNTSQDYLRTMNFDSGYADDNTFDLFKQLETRDSLSLASTVKVNSLTK